MIVALIALTAIAFGSNSQAEAGQIVSQVLTEANEIVAAPLEASDIAEMEAGAAGLFSHVFAYLAGPAVHYWKFEGVSGVR